MPKEFITFGELIEALSRDADPYSQEELERGREIMDRRLKRPTDAPALYSQDGQGYNATVYAHYFLGGNDWFITEYDPENDEAFGWARLNGDTMNAELGYIPMAELEAISIKLLGNELYVEYDVELYVEYDVNWTQRTLTESIKLLG